MIKSMYVEMVEYLQKHSYVSFKKMFHDLTYGGGCNTKAFKRAYQDLKTSGRIQFGIDDTLRINI